VTDVRTDGPVSCTIDYRGESVRVQLQVAGVHNAINAAGVVAVLVTLGTSFADAAHAVEDFTGTIRRFELHGIEHGVSVYDDYAHHPTEVAAALAAARTVVGDGRIIAIQQPHTYSRTQHMAQEFADVLEQYADHTVMLDVYGAREDPIPGVTGETVSARFADPAHVHFVPDWQQAADYTASIAHPGDFVITLGCGNVYLIIPQVLAALAENASTPITEP
jgi:UDP-N-acetylmuramate--alanine ligase